MVSKKKNFDAVVLDVGGVILHIDWDRPFEFAGIFDSRVREELIHHFYGWEHFHRFERGEITPEQFFQGFNELTGQQRSLEFWQEAWNRLIIGELPGVNEIFDRLHGKIPVCALSNTNIIHYQYMIKAFPVMRRFDRFFASHELGLRKPDAAIYLRVAEELKTEPDRLLFVDDSRSNIEAARRVGLTSAVTENSPHATIEFLSQYIEYI
jgi:putative hydrolase of the HAD superfamily